jgi:MFS family permease
VKSVASYLRGLDPDLPRPVWILQAGGLVNAVGNGVVMPFLFIYLHNVQGFSQGLTGGILAWIGAVGLAAGPVVGAIVDRLGGRRALTAALLVMTVGYGGLAVIEEPWHALAIGAIAGVGNAGFWPSQGALLAGLTEGAARHSAYAMQRITMNLGIGIGGLLGGVIATTSDPDTFTTLFVLDAATFIGYALILQLVPDPEIPPHEGSPGTYRDVVRDRAFMAVVGLNVVFIAAGMALLMQILPPFAKNEAGVTEDQIGQIFFLNTLFIVLAQLPVSKLIEGHRRMRVLMVMGLLWALAWLIVAAGGAWFEATAAAIVFAVAAVVFAVGETLQGPIWGPLVADLSPPQLRGRYMALSTGSWGVGLVIGPALGGLALGWHPVALWPIAAGVLVVMGAASLALERWIPEPYRVTPRRRRPDAAPATAPVPGTQAVVAQQAD